VPSALSPQPSLRITVLGSGTSHGVPSIGCDCAVCRSSDPKDRRTRPSILIEIRESAAATPFALAVRSILVDTSTDLREQALARGLRRVDQIQKTAIPCFADSETLTQLRRMFGYVFEPPKQQGGGLPQLSLFPLAGAFTLGGVEIVPIPVFHGRLPVLGFRIGSFAYLTDCNRIPDESFALLDGVRTVILDALRHRPHSTHFSVAEAIDASRRMGAERAYFTHICHDLGHAETSAQLPVGVELAYDGLVLEIHG
jgi:phosphoribosyl 1,2-cyclic phosphate phosphodiesterase